MKKEIVLIKGSRDEEYASFKARMFALGSKILKAALPQALKVSLTESGPPLLSVIPFRREKCAAFSIYEGSGAKELLLGTDGLTGIYSVEEAIPVYYEKQWKDGLPTPGVCLLTLFHQKPGIDRENFIRRWHEGHTPLSLRLHPLWNYNRNVVLQSLDAQYFWYDGIVEEQFKIRNDLLNPFIFFGPPLKVPRHMMEVWKDTRSFIDMKQIETYLAVEYHLKSPTRSQ